MKSRMKWLYQVAGGHTHVRVFMNGAKCGDLCFRNEEFESIIRDADSSSIIEFQKEQPANHL